MSETNIDTSKIYEISFLFKASLSMDDVQKEVDSMRKQIESSGLVILAEEMPKLRRLAYTIVKSVGGKREKYDEAYFGWIKFEGGPDGMENVKKYAKGDSNIIRSMIIKTVRENTLYSSKVVPHKEKPIRKEGDTKQAISAEELDKTIDEMVKEA